MTETKCDHRDSCDICKRSWKAMDDIIRHYRKQTRELEAELKHGK